MIRALAAVYVVGAVVAGRGVYSELRAACYPGDTRAKCLVAAATVGAMWPAIGVSALAVRAWMKVRL